MLSRRPGGLGTNKCLTKSTLRHTEAVMPADLCRSVPAKHAHVGSTGQHNTVVSVPVTGCQCQAGRLALLLIQNTGKGPPLSLVPCGPILRKAQPVSETRLDALQGMFSSSIAVRRFYEVGRQELRGWVQTTAEPSLWMISDLTHNIHCQIISCKYQQSS